MSIESNETDKNNITKLEEEISNFFEDLMYDRGGSPLLGRIYALCALKKQESYTQADLIAKFKVNSSTISRNLKDLEQIWGLISKKRNPGSREWLYYIDDSSFFELLVHNFESNVNNLQDRKEGLLRIKSHWGNLTDKSSQISIKTLDHLLAWIEIVDAKTKTFIADLHIEYLKLEKKLNRV